MAQRRLSRNEMHRLGPCLTALRVLAKSKAPHRDVLIEKYIDEYLRNDRSALPMHLSDFARLFTTKSLKGAKGRIGAWRRITFDYCCTGWLPNFSDATQSILVASNAGGSLAILAAPF